MRKRFSTCLELWTYINQEASKRIEAMKKEEKAGHILQSKGGTPNETRN
jgi:hypothetical protein